MSTTEGRSLEQARAGREEAVERVAAAADPEWMAAAARAVREVARRQRTFTSDDVWDRLAQVSFLDPAEPRSMGAVFRQAVKDEVCVLASCESCGTTKVMTTGRGRKSNAGDTPVYRSLLWRGL